MRFQILYRFSDKSASNCSIVCASTPAAPRLDFTAWYASYTKRLSMLNGLFVACIEVILLPVVSLNATASPDPFAPAPLQGLHRSYESARPSAPPRYSRLAVLATWAFSLHIGAAGSYRFVQPPASASRPLHAGHPLLRHPASTTFIPQNFITSGFDGT